MGFLYNGVYEIICYTESEWGFKSVNFRFTWCNQNNESKTVSVMQLSRSNSNDSSTWGGVGAVMHLHFFPYKMN